jgi:hypothetical protein
MRIALHLLCLLVILPYAVLATGFVLLGHAIASGSLLRFFESLLYNALWLLSWKGLAVVGTIVVVAALGFFVRSRWLGAACVALVAAASVIVVLTLGTDGLEFGHLLFLAPCVAAGVGAGWLAETEWPWRRSTSGDGRT